MVKRFGGVAAIDGITFAVAEGEILGVIGPNGAGKTTLLNCISGVYRPDAGEILWQGASIAGRAPHRVAALGIGRTFQVVKPFTSMTVRENAAVGALFGSAEAHLPPRQAFARADEVLELVGLAGKAALPVTSLTIPDRKRLEVARAVATKPRLLLLDEVMAGLNHVEVEEALEMVRAVHRRCLGSRPRPSLRQGPGRGSSADGAQGPARDRGLPGRALRTGARWLRPCSASAD